ncbi:unnamed protein product [Dovyalis caffra]|uniref:Uncharacterized protein n=1 Tax=Dovyalis caffra TaxID=77055 RepID=A0AAV1QM04_9ROSI|nr:unnamed protein product [Dovyalis caffra]
MGQSQKVVRANSFLWMNNELRAPVKEKMRNTMKAWNIDGRPLKMTFGTGFPPIYSKGSSKRIVPVVLET